jgi:hypothetical protein
VYENKDNGVKYVFDYGIAKELFSCHKSAIRYTCLITDSKSNSVDEIEKYLNYFPVFSDLESYEAVFPHAKKIQEAVERRLSQVPIEAFLENEITAALDSHHTKIDLLSKIKNVNASVAVKALGWVRLIDSKEFIEWSEVLFSMFSGEIGKAITDDDIKSVKNIIDSLRRKEFTESCLGKGNHDYDLCASTFMQWITGFMTPSISWIGYTFLQYFQQNIVTQSGNFLSTSCPYSRRSPQKIANSCLKNYMPFQAIHRLAIKDFSINGYEFKDGDFICIIPDSLFGEHTDSEVISSVIGAPHRACMGMPTSTLLTKHYLKFFEKYSVKFDDYDVFYDFVPSLSALTFSNVELCMSTLKQIK